MIPPTPQPPAEISYRFYAALDAIERNLLDIARRHPDLKEVCNDFCNDMEIVHDDVIAIAATKGWRAAYHESDFLEFKRDYEDLVRRSV